MLTPEPDDTHLVAQARAGDRAAFVELVARHQPLLSGLCRRMVGEPQAEDAAQEAILQALLALDTLKRPEQFGPWLAGIGLNICRRWLARRGQMGSLDALLGGGHIHQPLDTLVTNPAWAAEESDAETAAALGIPIGAVKTRLPKARQRLRHQLWSLWEDVQPMSTQTPEHVAPDELVEVRVIDVRRVLPDQEATIARNVVLLQEQGGAERILGIWIGAFESEAILLLLEGIELPRPLTFTYASNLLSAAGGRLVEVRVHRLTDDTFYAATVVQPSDGQERVIDCRPSDGVALALAVNAPIRVAEIIMQQSADTPRQVEEGLHADGQRVLSGP